jgi:hypothetical protein
VTQRGWQAGAALFHALQREAFESPDGLADLLGKIPYAAQR